MEDALGVAAEDRSLRVDAELCLADDADRFRIAEPERMVTAEQDAVVADGPREIAERLRPLDERVVVEAPEVAAGKSSAVRARLGPGPMGAVEAADVIGQEPAAVHEHHRERRKPVERAA